MKKSGQTLGKVVAVKSALRVMDVLEYFARFPEPASLAKLCIALELPKSSCHALMETLRSHGYVYWLGRQQGYYPTKRWHDLGQAILTHDPVLSLTDESLRRISKISGETAILAKREGYDILYLDVVEPNKTLRFSAHAGQIKPIHSAASGRALLSMMSQSEQAELLNQLKLQAFSDRTITELHRLYEVIEAGQRRGFHVVIGENQPDTIAIAVAVKIGSEFYSLTVGGPVQRLENRQDEVGQLLMQEATTIAAF